jgi:hypothetical protein
VSVDARALELKGKAIVKSVLKGRGVGKGRRKKKSEPEIEESESESDSDSEASNSDSSEGDMNDDSKHVKCVVFGDLFPKTEKIIRSFIDHIDADGHLSAIKSSKGKIALAHALEMAFLHPSFIL